MTAISHSIRNPELTPSAGPGSPHARRWRRGCALRNVELPDDGNMVAARGGEREIRPALAAAVDKFYLRLQKS